MKRLFFKTQLALVLLLILTCCERRELEVLVVETCTIPITIDWESKAKLQPGVDTENLYRASVWFFSKGGVAFDNGKRYKEIYLDNPTGGEVQLPVGRYSVLVFNNSVGSFSSNVGFRGIDRYDTFEYYVCSAPGARAGEENPVLEPDILAVWSMDDYEVTRDMVVQKHQLDIPLTAAARAKAEEDLKRLLNLKPERLTYTVHTEACVHNLSSTRAAEARLSGMAHSVRLASREVADTPSSFSFRMKSASARTPGNSPHNTIEAHFSSLGLLDNPNSSYTAELIFFLGKEYEGSTTYPTPPASPFRFDVEWQVLRSFNDENQSKEVDIRIRLGHCLWEYDGDSVYPGDYPTIYLPDLANPGGFMPDVGDWDEEEDIPIPLG